MPKTDPQAVLTLEQIKACTRVARATGPLPFALFSWMYEFGARAAEPGLQLLKDIDLANRRARPTHLKAGATKSWHVLLSGCKEALPAWMDARPAFVIQHGQKPYLFPSRVPGRCYTCRGTGIRARLMTRPDGSRYDGDHVSCHHCGETGLRWGLSRFEVHAIISKILTTAGMPNNRTHPHVLRHSIISHLLDGGVPATTIRDRVGHRNLQTTLNYAQMTDTAGIAMEKALERTRG